LPAPAVSGVPTLPNGNVAPVVVTFEGELIVAAGTLPSQAAVDRLSRIIDGFNDAGRPVINTLTVNPDMPVNVGVRFLGLDPVAFEAGSPEITEPHAVALLRVADLINSLDGVSVLVVGHRESGGEDENNLGLSQLRADAVVAYLVSQDVDPSRLTAIGAGELEPILLGDPNDPNDASAVNRRVEFVFYGLGG